MKLRTLPLLTILALAACTLLPQELMARLPATCRQGFEENDPQERIRLLTLCEQEELSEEDLILVYSYRGVSYAAQGLHSQAIDEYSTLLYRDPDHLYTYINRAVSYLRKQQYLQALYDLNTAESLDTEEDKQVSEKIYENRGEVYFYLEDYTNAAADFTKTLELNPSNTLALNNRGSCYLKLSQFTDALADFNQVLETNPKSLTTLKNRANTLVLLGRMEEAEADFTSIEKLSKEAPAEAQTDEVLVLQAETSGTTPEIEPEQSNEVADETTETLSY